MRTTDKAGAMKQKIIWNSILAGIILLGIVLWNYVVHGEPINPRMFLVLPILIPLIVFMGFMIWLRWDWAPEKRRKKRAERQREKDAETFK